MIEDFHENIAVIAHKRGGGETRIGLCRQLRYPERSRLVAFQLWTLAEGELAPRGKPILLRREDLPDAIQALETARDELDREAAQWARTRGR